MYRVTLDDYTPTAFVQMDFCILRLDAGTVITERENMSMQLNIYVGPYLVLPKTFEWYDWDQIVIDGRFEAGTDDEYLYLVPNVKLTGIDRQLLFERGEDTPVLIITEAMISRETEAMFALADPILQHCKQANVPIRIRWGIVPCWS